jgi:hypothetical protein
MLVPALSVFRKSFIRFVNQAVVAVVIFFVGLIPVPHMGELIESSEVSFAGDAFVSHVGSARSQRKVCREKGFQIALSGRGLRNSDLNHSGAPYRATGHRSCNGDRLPLLC